VSIDQVHKLILSAHNFIFSGHNFILNVQKGIKLEVNMKKVFKNFSEPLGNKGCHGLRPCSAPLVTGKHLQNKQPNTHPKNRLRLIG
jgi:hypothetical protein